ncbi:MAG: hypothetical protein A4S09_15390 [Proteobacteria bacterium SG_bin7]|nr:MAG: hypothetical protein A4S09_15390 [Proteobacteria bacterium SG_bin7]
MKNSVLLLDDDADLIAAMSELISMQSNRHALTARSVAELEALGDKVHACDIAFLDVNLGANRPSGIVAAKWLREQGFKGKMYFFTGHAGNHPLVIQASSVSGVEIIHKPVDIKFLFDLLHGAKRD